MGEDVFKAIKPGEQIVKIFRDELAALLGGDQAHAQPQRPGPHPHLRPQRLRQNHHLRPNSPAA
jgi:hypothetical protein